MFLVYYLAVGVIGSFTVDLVDGLFAALSDWTRSSLANQYLEWLISLIVDGIIARVGAVLNFVPQLIISFLLNRYFGNNRLYVANCVLFGPGV